MSTSSKDLARRNRQKAGQQAEEFAAQYLEQSLGWTILERNWRCRKGELDLIAWDGSGLIIIEVRSRSQTYYGEPIEAIDERKLKQLQRVIPCYLWSRPGWESELIRVDAIALFLQNDMVQSLVHIRNVLDFG